MQLQLFLLLRLLRKNKYRTYFVLLHVSMSKQFVQILRLACEVHNFSSRKTIFKT